MSGLTDIFRGQQRDDRDVKRLLADYSPEQLQHFLENRRTAPPVHERNVRVWRRALKRLGTFPNLCDVSLLAPSSLALLLKHTPSGMRAGCVPLLMRQLRCFTTVSPELFAMIAATGVMPTLPHTVAVNHTVMALFASSSQAFFEHLLLSGHEERAVLLDAYRRLHRFVPMLESYDLTGRPKRFQRQREGPPLVYVSTVEQATLDLARRILPSTQLDALAEYERFLRDPSGRGSYSLLHIHPI